MSASIPVFDWNGSEFLGFYAVAFCIALAWSLWRRSRANNKFALPEGSHVELVDPYEIAFLAGGAPRCAQVAVARLLDSGAVIWTKTKILRESRLVAKGQAAAGFNDIERTLFSSILSYREKGMPLTGVSQLVATRLSGIEAKLAKSGLRPTGAEEGSRGCFIVLPMAMLVLIGLAKVVIGISRDKPVGFLVVFLFVTLFAGACVAASRKKLTPAGESLLSRMRAEALGNDAFQAIALLGISASGYHLAGIDAAMRKEISQMGNSSASSDGGSGCSSGCSSGCGSGCGGCGGD